MPARSCFYEFSIIIGAIVNIFVFTILATPGFVLAETVMVKDMTGISIFPNLMAAGSKVYFSASHPAFGQELWTSDGTEEGTVMVKDITPGNGSSEFNSPVMFNSMLYFESRKEIWKSDGTETGTVPVVTLSGRMEYPVVIDDHLYFWVNYWTSRLYSLDKSGGTTQHYKSDFTVSLPTRVGTYFFFGGYDSVSGSELWLSDKTQDGTFLVKDIWKGTGASSPRNLTAVGTTLFFTALDEEHGREIWRSDGTSSGTLLVKDLTPEGGSTEVFNSIGVGSTLFFTFRFGENGELWKTDGTESGTVLVKDTTPNASSSNKQMRNFIAMDNILYFSFSDSQGNYSMWRSDGTAEGTYVIKECLFQNPTVSDSTLFFRDKDYRLWRSDGTGKGTVKVSNKVRLGNGSVFVMASVDQILYFPGYSNDNTWGLLKSDGIPDFETTHTLTIYLHGEGAVSLTPEQDFYEDASEVILYATTTEGFIFSGWSGDVTSGNETINPLVITMDADKNITATFEAIVVEPTPVAAPTNVQATDGIYLTKVLVTWDASTSPTATYYQIKISDGVTEVPTPWQTALSFAHTSATQGVVYTYSVAAAEDDMGTNASVFSVSDTGSITLDADKKLYKVSYSKAAVTADEEGSLAVIGDAKGSLKVQLQKKTPRSVEPKEGKYFYLFLRTIPTVNIVGAMNKVAIDAPVVELKSSGVIKSLTTNNNIELVNTAGIGSLKMTVYLDDKSETAATTILTTGSGDMKLSLLGVILESLDTTQSMKYIKVGSKAWKNTAKAKVTSLGGIGRIGSAADATVSTVNASGGIKLISTKGCSIAPDTIVSGGTTVLSVSAKLAKMNGVPYAGFLGLADASPMLRVIATNMKNIYGYNGIAAILIAGADANGAPTYSGGIKQIGAKKGIGVLVGEAYISPTAKDIKFKSDQGTFTVYTSPPTP